MKKKCIGILIVAIIILLPFTALSSSLKLIMMKIGSKTVYVDMSPVILDVAPVEIDGRTLVPLRFIAEQMGAKNITYYPETEEVSMELFNAGDLKKECDSLRILLSNSESENLNLKSQIKILEKRIEELEKQKSNDADIKPYPPTNVHCSYTNNQISIMWYPSKQGSNAIMGYKVYKLYPSTGTFLLISTLPSNTNTYADSEIKEGSTYQYYVKSFDSNLPPLESDQSNIAFVTIPVVKNPEPPPQKTKMGESRDNPVPCGTAYLTENGLQIQVVEFLKGDAAWEVLREHYNDKPEEGMQYVLITLNIVNIDTKDEPEWINAVHFNYLGSSNIAPDQLVYQPDKGKYRRLDCELFHQGQVTSSLAYYVPSNDTEMRIAYDSYVCPLTYFEVK